MARRCGLTTLDWIVYRDAELRALGADPADRICFTGHTRCLPEPYLATIGAWGAYEVLELVNDAEPHKATVPVSSVALRRFKGRYRLRSRAQFVRLYGPAPWARAEVCFLAHEAAQRAFGRHGGRGPIGVACDYARMARLCSRSGCSVGLMPVEMVLWTRVLDALLAHHGFTLDDWAELDDASKTKVWDLGGDHGPWSINPFLHGEPVRVLPAQCWAVAS